MSLIEFGTKSSVKNARGSYISYQYAASVNARAGIALTNVARRHWNSDVIVTLEYQLLAQTRTWIGLFSGDPAGTNDPNTLSGFGVRYEFGTDGPPNPPPTAFRSWSCDGAGTSIVKVLDGTAPLGEMPVDVNVQYRVLLRHVKGSAGKFQAWLQMSDDDGTAADGVWTLLAEHDANNAEFVPAAATDLSLYVTSENLDGAATNRGIRIKSVDFEQS